ncbi:MAG: elongation factor P [Bacilli bacterium]|nr:elongation factor P [Bacilli bacterium]MDD4376497.1 elongation factor P [Clostridia bacterium]MDD4734303.1 elongation factor P [Bacilli bacterium]
MINVNDIKNGMTIRHEGNIYQVMDFLHVKPGKGAAFVKAKLKNLRTGATVEYTFNSSIKLEKANISKTNMQYLYSSGDKYVFMNMETYDQIELTSEQLGDEAEYLKENLSVDLTFFEDELLGISLPEKIEYEVIQTEPAVKGNTTTNANKDAQLENGMTVKVPLFIENGEKIIISTKDGRYDSRA